MSTLPRLPLGRKHFIKVTDIECLWQVCAECSGGAVYGVRVRPEPGDDPTLYPVWPACDPCAMKTRHEDPLAEVIPIPDWVREQVG